MKTLFLAVFLCNMYKYSHSKNLSWIKITILTTLHNTRAISRTCVERRVRTGCQVVKTSAGRFKRPGEPTFVSRATIVKLHNRPNSVYKVAEKQYMYYWNINQIRLHCYFKCCKSLACACAHYDIRFWFVITVNLKWLL